MKNKLSCLLLILVIFFMTAAAGCGSEEKAREISSIEANKMKIVSNKTEYNDGTYDVITAADGEGYYTKAKMTLKDNKITKIDWTIWDIHRNIPFDDSYEKVYEGKTRYIEQCRTDMVGVRQYGSKLIEKQDINRVDAITGATWTNKKFKEAVTQLLDKAKKK